MRILIIGQYEQVPNRGSGLVLLALMAAIPYVLSGINIENLSTPLFHSEGLTIVELMPNQAV